MFTREDSNPLNFTKGIHDCFNPQKLKNNDLLVDELLNFLGAESQRDKRKPWDAKFCKIVVDKYDSVSIQNQ
jgi:hypothetical protein